MARIVNAVLLLLLLCAGGAALLWRLAATPGLRRDMAAASWTDGSVTAVLDAQVDRSMVRFDAIDNWLNGLLYAATGDTGPQVRQGCPGWLFLAEETAATPHGERNLAQRRQLAGLMRAALRQRGITLIITPVPDKVEQAQAQLCGLAVSDQARGRRAAWGVGAGTVDLHTGWPRPAYWRTDTHWDRTGAAWAAQRVASVVHGVVHGVLPGGATPMTSIAGPPVRRIGDLARLAGLADNAPPFGPAPEIDHAVTLQIARSGFLLDDVAAPQVLLAGSSYSLNSGFIESLQLALRQDVSQQSRLGSGFAGSLLDVLAHPGRLDGVRVVVWEWPLRVLYQPLSAAESRYLQAATKARP